MSTAEQEYQAKQGESGFKIGDRVRILRKANSHESGWGTVWLNCMDALVGKVGTIEDATFEDGFRIKVPGETGCYYFPYFVLEKVSKRKMAAPRKRWRFLKENETARKGDFYRFGPDWAWEPMKELIGHDVTSDDEKYRRYRRPVKTVTKRRSEPEIPRHSKPTSCSHPFICSLLVESIRGIIQDLGTLAPTSPALAPTQLYRMLDAGEVLQAGDEYNPLDLGWIPVHGTSFGHPLNLGNVGRFRRPLPEFKNYSGGILKALESIVPTLAAAPVDTAAIKEYLKKFTSDIPMPEVAHVVRDQDGFWTAFAEDGHATAFFGDNFVKNVLGYSFKL